MWHDAKKRIQDAVWEWRWAGWRGTGRDGRTRFAIPNSQARTPIGKYYFSLFSWPRAGLATLPGWSIILLYVWLYIHTVYLYYFCIDYTCKQHRTDFLGVLVINNKLRRFWYLSLGSKTDCALLGAEHVVRRVRINRARLAILLVVNSTGKIRFCPYPANKWELVIGETRLSRFQTSDCRGWYHDRHNICKYMLILFC